MSGPGPLNGICDVAGLSLGCAGDATIRTGVTVILADRQIPAGVFVGGGGPGARETHVLDPKNLVGRLDAVVLSGGSVYGLAAADGVTAALGARQRGFRLPGASGVPTAPIVAGAILYDLANGGDKNWGDTPPYARLGRIALDAAMAGTSPLPGNVGAGLGARAGALKGGQGEASYRTDDGYVVAALAAVNSFGAVVAPAMAGEKGHRFWAGMYEIGDEFGGLGPPMGPQDPEEWGLAKSNPRNFWPRAARTSAPVPTPGRENTTLAVVAVDADLTTAECEHLAFMAQAGFARAIRPVFAPFDGDIVFALATGARPVEGDRAMLLARLGAIGAECLARAIARGVYCAESLGEWPGWRDLPR